MENGVQQSLPLNLTPVPVPVPVALTLTIAPRLGAYSFAHQSIFDLACTGLEGGCDYWFDRITAYDLFTKKGEERDEKLGTCSCKVWASGLTDDDQSRPYDLNSDAVVKGLVQVAEKKANILDEQAAEAHALTAILILLGQEDVDYDACFADIVIQCGLFSEVVFG